MLDLFSIISLLFLMLGGTRFLHTIVLGRGSGVPPLDVSGTLQLLNSSHVRERDKALHRGVLVGGVWNEFQLGGVRGQLVLCRFYGGPDGDGHFFGNAPIVLLMKSVKILSFTIS